MLPYTNDKQTYSISNYFTPRGRRLQLFFLKNFQLKILVALSTFTKRMKFAAAYGGYM
jgi:hypothetical protein